MDATPSVRLPAAAGSGLPDDPPAPLAIGRRLFEWGSRTFVMGIINVTPDSFSGDGLLARSEDPAGAAVELARQMAQEGADLLDIGAVSTRPGHAEVDPATEADRVLPVIRAVREALPDMPLSVDTTAGPVAAEALDAGADMINDVWGVGDDDRLARLAAERGTPLVVMHNRVEARYRSVVAEVLADLSRALDRALRLGLSEESLIVDPGIGFGKTAEQNLVLLGELEVLTRLGRPILLGTSRKSTIGKVLDLPADQRLEGTLATTALGIAAGADIVRVHDVAANVRAARISDAIVRGGWREERAEGR
ncbi:MAG TPA: dihydropteroate synthase [Candidatus Limnocylindrales bacterium]|nr:dihydropteroate synthase [Candidatus Limnocylindrales bacterium]